MAEKLLPYDRAIVRQETGYWCGPASVQIVLDGLGIRISEPQLARELGTHTGGTDHIGLVTTVLRARTGLDYGSVTTPNDPPTDAQRARLWRDITETIEAGRGMVVNWVAPRSNYPRAVAPSTISPAYSGGTVYHYVALMGYSDEGTRRVWIADPGFSPYGYWLSFAQLCTLIPPKGYSAAPGPALAPPPPALPAPPARAGMTVEVLAEAMGRALPLARYAELLPGMIGAMRAADITSARRAAAWCAQLGHESAGLRYMEEIATGAAYEWRKDLGNTHPGDGTRFKGSGPIQLTGRHNFTAFSRWAAAAGHTTDPDLFVRSPELVRTNPAYGFLAATWYWTQARPQLNRLADAGDLEGVTRAINGGLNGLADRRTRYNRCLALGEQLLPPPLPQEDEMTDDERQMLREIHHELTHRFQSRVVVGENGELSEFRDTLVGYGLLTDAATHGTRLAVAELHDAVDTLTGLVTKLANQIGEKR